MKGGIVNFLALVILICLIWFGGGYLEWEGKTRIGLICGVLAFWLLIYLYQRYRAIKTARMIEERLREQAAGQIAAGADPDALSDLQKRLDEAMGALKQSGLGRSALATVPWYIIIGPPGSGKSTALQASGLEFPKTGTGLNGIQGVGGTRNCEWWFTNEGILLDTAGRYTSVEDDRDEWVGFLDMIKATRSRTPINGVIVAISLADIATGSDEELNTHAANIRARLDELCQRLQTVFPVYLLFTKCDLLTGFVDFFGDMGRGEREEVWGFTFPFQSMKADRYQQVFRRELGELYGRLTKRRLGLLTTERPPEKQQQVYSFPLQLAAVEEQLTSFIGKVFRENPYQESAILRGFYFSSGTQEGNPIDQVMGSLRQAFGVTAAAPEAGGLPEPSVEKKSYFLTGLFRKLIFPDSVLARSLASAEKRRRLTHLTLISGSIAASLLLVVAFLTSFIGNRALLGRIEVGAAAVKNAQADENTPVVQRLEALELLREGVLDLQEYSGLFGPPVRLRFGLYSGSDVFDETRKAYTGELNTVLLGPCKKQIEGELKAWIDPKADTAALKARYAFKHDQELYDGLYRLLRVYKMLGDDLPLDAEEIRIQLKNQNRWLSGLGTGPKDAPKPEQSALAQAQLDALLVLEDYIAEWKVELDAALVHEVQEKLKANYWISQSYTQIRDSQLSQAGTDSVTSLFPEGHEVFAEIGPVSKVFTKEKWESHLQSAVREKSTYLAAQYKEMSEPKSEDQIRSELRDHYVSEGRQRWTEFLKGLQIQPFTGVEQGAKRLAVLGSPRSPLPKLFKEVWKLKFVLDAPPAAKFQDRLPPKVKSDEDAPTETWHVQLQKQLSRLGLALDEVAKKPEGERLYARAVANTLAELDPLRTTYQEVEKEILDVILPQVPVIQEEFAKRIVGEVLAAARAGVQAEAQREADAAWSKGPQGIYASKFAERYPFAPEAKEETSLDEFTRLLKPKEGTLWVAVEAHKRLAAYTVGGQGLLKRGVRYEGAVNDAERLRDALFNAAGELSLELKIKPYKRTGVKNVRFTLGKESITENELPPNRRHTMSWGTERGAKVSLLGADQSEWAHVDHGNSSWGLVRLLADGTFDPETSKDGRFRFTWSFTLDGEQRLGEVEFGVEHVAGQALFTKELFKGHTAFPPRIEQ